MKSSINTRNLSHAIILLFIDSKVDVANSTDDPVINDVSEDLQNIHLENVNNATDHMQYSNVLGQCCAF